MVTSADSEHLNGASNGSTQYREEAIERAKKLIKQEDLDRWHKHGFVVIERFLTDDEIRAIQADLFTMMPTWDEYKNRKHMFQYLHGASPRANPASGIVRNDFPYPSDALNQVAVHPFLLAFVEVLLGHPNFAMGHGTITTKYAGKGDYDQALHSDYSNNTLVVPQKGLKSTDVPVIIYHTDVTIDLGPTYVVSQEHTRDRDLIIDGMRHHTREAFPELYKVEQPVLVPAGSAVIYSMHTFHRGSRMTAKEGMRVTQFTGFHTTDAPWYGQTNWQGLGGHPDMDRFLLHSSPRQRAMVDFPPVGHEYWDDEWARLGVSNRYPTMDMTPYGGRPGSDKP